MAGGTRTGDAGPEASGLDPAHAEAVLLRHAGAGPRYTSYPTAPVWSEAYGPAAFQEDLASTRPGADLSVYVHVPFCRSLCHFCACNRVITRRPEDPERYLETLAREVDRLRASLPEERGAAQHHWGGGTPTHLAPPQLRRLFRSVAAVFPARPGAEISIEVDPRVTTPAQLEVLRECGFDRISMGVQDFDPRVQAAIHRIQTPEQTGDLVARARALGFTSVGFDLIYGLPFQTEPSMEATLDRVLALAPDRLAVYAYAHVTWVAKQQRGFERGDLPDPRSRVRIFLAVLARLRRAGYVHVGLDHFARPDDALARALADGTLRRNFMGYTTRAGLEVVGLGPSAISELASGYAQSHRDLAAWTAALEQGRLATLRGHRLSPDDRERAWVIGRILCQGEVRAADWADRFGGRFGERFAADLRRLEPLAEDGLVTLATDGSLRVTTLGRLAMRQLAMAFDAWLPRQGAESARFSQTV